MEMSAQKKYEAYSEALRESVRGYLNLNGLSCERMAKESGVSTSTIKRICNGKEIPHVSTLFVLSEYMKEDLLLKGEYLYEADFIRKTKQMDIATKKRCRDYLDALINLQEQEEELRQELSLTGKGKSSVWVGTDK